MNANNNANANVNVNASANVDSNGGENAGFAYGDLAAAELELRAAQEKMAAAQEELRIAQEKVDAARARSAAYQAPTYQAPAYQAPAYQNQAYQQAHQQPVGASKDHVAAGLLAIFLGSLGIHKFYLGYNKPGFILLAVTVLGSIFTLGLAAVVTCIIAFIEGIIYLVKSQDEFERIYVFGRKEWF